MAVLGMNDRSEYNNTKDQSSAGRMKWPRRRAQSSPLRAARRVRPTQTFYKKRLVSNDSNGALEKARSTSPTCMSHAGMAEGFYGVLLLNELHSLLSVPNCAAVKICLSERTDRIAALNAQMVEAAKLRSSNKNNRMSPKFLIVTETGS